MYENEINKIIMKRSSSSISSYISIEILLIFFYRLIDIWYDDECLIEKQYDDDDERFMTI